MKSFSISIDIDATTDRVWRIMRDIERWHEWTPSVRSIRKFGAGDLRVGTRAMVRQPELPPAFWRVIALDPGRSFTWVSKGPGMIVTARHSVEPTSRGSRATLSIAYGGLLAPLVLWMTRDVNEPYLEMEANGLKRRSESREADR